MIKRRIKGNKSESIDEDGWIDEIAWLIPPQEPLV